VAVVPIVVSEEHRLLDDRFWKLIDQVLDLTDAFMELDPGLDDLIYFDAPSTIKHQLAKLTDCTGRLMMATKDSESGEQYSLSGYPLVFTDSSQIEFRIRPR
jgi:hypothetical protein